MLIDVEICAEALESIFALEFKVFLLFALVINDFSQSTSKLICYDLHTRGKGYILDIMRDNDIDKVVSEIYSLMSKRIILKIICTFRIISSYQKLGSSAKMIEGLFIKARATSYSLLFPADNADVLWFKSVR